MKTDWSDASSSGLRTVGLYDLGELLHNLHRGKRCGSKRLSRAERLEDVRVLNGAKVWAIREGSAEYATSGDWMRTDKGTFGLAMHELLRATV